MNNVINFDRSHNDDNTDSFDDALYEDDENFNNANEILEQIMTDGNEIIEQKNKTDIDEIAIDHADCLAIENMRLKQENIRIQSALLQEKYEK